jgi:hypothetical protein
MPDNSVQKKLITLAVFNLEEGEKKTLLGTTKIKVAQFWQHTNLQRQKSTLKTNRSVKPVLVSQWFLGNATESGNLKMGESERNAPAHVGHKNTFEDDFESSENSNSFFPPKSSNIVSGSKGNVSNSNNKLQAKAKSQTLPLPQKICDKSHEKEEYSYYSYSSESDSDLNEALTRTERVGDINNFESTHEG